MASAGGVFLLTATTLALGCVFAGLVVGKPLGITVFSWIAVRLAFASRRSGATWPMIGATGLLGGIGFTMSLFIAGLAFADASLLDAATFGILAASTVAGVGGAFCFAALQLQRAPDSPYSTPMSHAC